MVVPNDTPKPCSSAIGVGSSFCITDALNEFIAGSIRPFSNGFLPRKQQNVLSLGYRLKRFQSDAELRHNADIECFCGKGFVCFLCVCLKYYCEVNTVHLFLQTHNWRRIAQRLGKMHRKLS